MSISFARLTARSNSSSSPLTHTTNSPALEKFSACECFSTWKVSSLFSSSIVSSSATSSSLSGSKSGSLSSSSMNCSSSSSLYFHFLLSFSCFFFFSSFSLCFFNNSSCFRYSASSRALSTTFLCSVTSRSFAICSSSSICLCNCCSLSKFSLHLLLAVLLWPLCFADSVYGFAYTSATTTHEAEAVEVEVDASLFLSFSPSPPQGPCHPMLHWSLFSILLLHLTSFSVL